MELQVYNAGYQGLRVRKYQLEVRTQSRQSRVNVGKTEKIQNVGKAQFRTTEFELLLETKSDSDSDSDFFKVCLD